MNDRDEWRARACAVLGEISSSPHALARFLEGYSGSEDPIELLRDICRPGQQVDSGIASATAAEHERIVFGPGHSADEVEVAAAALRDAYSSRQAATTALEDGIRRYEAATTESRSGSPAGSQGDAVVDVAQPERRRWLPLAAAFAGGLLATAVTFTVAGLGSAGREAQPTGDASATQGGSRSAEPAEVERGDARIGARTWFDVAQAPVDELPQAGNAVDPASSRYVGSAGRLRVWVAQDRGAGYCIVTTALSASTEMAEVCVTAEEFHQLGVNVVADRVYIQWTGANVEFTISPRDPG